MGKIIPIGILITSTLFGFNAEIKKASVTLSINNQEKTYTTKENFTLNAGDMLCFSSGEGRVVIQNSTYKKQLSKRSKSCIHLPTEEGKSTSYTQEIQNTIVSIFEKSKEKSVDGVSRKNTETETLTTPIFLTLKAKYIVIENSTWGPLPMVLELIDAKGTVTETMVNEEDITTSFILPRAIIKDGYTIKVSNSFEEVLMNSKIHLQAKP